ncbi:TonB-dependent receptor plug domain-containing protein [Massilia sp. TN1-12]|uniref:TonB-dependent receptor plug domain-containing protein n=1 Tax=Massilia paldalensis TaxID=3377675 RepID=UPI00384CAF49
MPENFTLSPLVLAVLALAATCASAGEDDTRPAALADLPLEQLMQVQTVTSASRFEQSLRDAPSAVSVLTAQDIREYGWRTLADALASLPGLYVSSDRNYTYLGARGFLRPGDYDSRFLLLIDGVRANDNVYDQAALGNDAMLDIDLVERIEYVPGPGAAVYGSNALFGVINVITKSGSALAGVQAAQSFGSQGERRSRVSYGWHAQDGSDAVLSASSYRRRGGDLYFPEFDGDGGNGIAHGLDWERATNLYAKLHRGGLTFGAGYVDRSKGVATASFGAVFDAPDATRDSRAFANLDYQKALAPALDVAASLYWGRSDYLAHGLYPGETGAPHINVDGDHGSWYGMHAHAAYAGLAGHRIVVGVEWNRNRRRDQFNYDIDPYASLLDDRRGGTRRSVFVEDEWRLDGATIVNAGLRHDRDSEAGNRTSPRIALIRTVTAKDTVKLIYGTAFRAPNAYERYYAIPVPGGQAPNPGLLSEDIHTRELVWEHNPHAHAKLSAVLFSYRMHDLITQLEDPETGLLQFTNTERARAHGVELAGENTDARGVRTRVSYSWQRTADTLGRGLVNSPRQLLKAGASVPLALLNARLAGEWQCATQRLTEHARVGGYCIANLVLSSTGSRAHGWNWSLAVYNAAGHHHADPAGPAFVQEAIARDGRSVVGKLEYGF